MEFRVTREKKSLHLDKPILLYKHIDRKLQIILISLMKIEEGSLFVEILNNGISFW